MLGRCRFLAFVLLLTSLGSAATAAPATTAPETPPPIADPCATAVPDIPNDLTSAFAYELTSPAILHFLTMLKTVPPRDQKATFERAIAATQTPAQQELENTEARVCPNLDEIYAETRAIVLVANGWSPLRDFDDPKQSAKFLVALHDTIAALSLGPRLTPAEQRTAQAAFAGLLDPVPVTSPDTAATTSAQPEGACALPRVAAKTLHAVAPQTPATAVASGTTGTVKILVSLNENGDVRSAKTVASTVADQPGADDMVRAAVLSAAQSTFAPELRNCTAIPGRYMFVVLFNRR
jgi:hypothetical protein